MKYMQMTSFRKVPQRKPRREPIPDFSAVVESFLPKSSPINAPKNGPAIMPQGRMNMPSRVPMIHPQYPHLVPPKTLAPIEGTI